MQGPRGPKDVVGALVAAINDHDPTASRELFRSDAWVVTAAAAASTWTASSGCWRSP